MAQDDLAPLSELVAALTAAVRQRLRDDKPRPEPLEPAMPEDITGRFTGLNGWDTVYLSPELGLTVKVKTLRLGVFPDRIVYQVQASYCCPETAKAHDHLGHPLGKYICAPLQEVIHPGRRVDIAAALRRAHARAVEVLEHSVHHTSQHGDPAMSIRVAQVVPSPAARLPSGEIDLAAAPKVML
jgi:hypothetical protein